MEEKSSDPSLTTVFTSLTALFNGLPHFGSLSSSPTVIHVNASGTGNSLPDYGVLSALRHSGFVFLQSFNSKDARDISLASYLISKRLNKPVVHFLSVDSNNNEESILDYTTDQIEKALEAFTAPVEQSEEEQGDEENEKKEITPDYSKAEVVSEAFKYIKTSLSGQSYNSFEYVGPSKPTSAIVLFGSSVDPFVQAISQAKSSADRYGDVGLVLIRVYRPWSSTKLMEVLPKSVKRLAFAEQLHRQTTSWSPLAQDFLVDNSNLGDMSEMPKLISYQLGKVTYENVRTVLKSIAVNLKAEKPIQRLLVGSKIDGSTVTADEDYSDEAQKAARQLEEAYFKVLKQLFGNRLDTINELDRTDAGISTNPEYGFGTYLSQKDRQQSLVKKANLALKANDFDVNNKRNIESKLSQWGLQVQKKNNSDVDETLVDDLVGLLELEAQGESSTAKELLEDKDSFQLKSSWLVGSDAWAYDLGNSGVHHVISSGENINMLIIDSQPYSEVSSKPMATRKKDIGLYAMNFGNTYVASVAVYASYTQLLQAFIEAEKFNGPSVVVAYLPYNSEKDDALTVLQETKRAIESGYWPLYRYDPTLDEKDTFKLDSFHIKKNLQDFLDRENKLTLLSNRSPALSRNLNGSYGSKMREQQKKDAKDAYTKLLEGLSGPPLTILFASDGGGAEGVARRLQRRAKGRGLKAVAMAFDEYPVEELASDDNVVFITSTAGQGEFPQNGRQLWDALKNSTDIDLAAVNYSVFGMGDSLYWPRKEDKIYYNKPCRDLDSRLKVLGGQEMVPLGLGDDQDADGPSTAYNEWEPLLWKALGVDGVAGIEEPPPVTNEDIKINSNFLRGTIAEGLQDTTTGAIAANDQQLTKFHGIYMQDDRDVRDERKAQGLEPAYAFMVRVRLPGCIANADQWLRIDELADERGNGTFKITTRGTFQLHGVIKEDLKPAIRGMNASLIDTLAACGDVDRNVVAAALPENSKIHDEIVKIGTAISEHLLPSTTAYHEIWLEGEDASDKKGYTEAFENRKEGPKKKSKTLVAGSTLVDHEPLYGPTYLPRKFKINIAVPPNNDVDVYAHDIGLISILEDNELLGFNVLVGGGMGTTHNNKKTYPRTGSLLGFVPKDKIVEVCEKIMLVQRDNGDRLNRKHARLKYTIDDMGIDTYRSKTEELLGYSFEPSKPYHFDNNTDQFGWVTDENGLHHFTTFVENGRVEDTPELQFKTGLREVAKLMRDFSGQFRLTANQHILISDVPDDYLDQVKTILAKYRLDNVAFSGLRLSSAACVAFPTCGMAMAESERYLPELVTKLEGALEEYGLRHDSIVMRMTGCPNGCARPWVAEIALVGKAPGTYNLMLGGGFHGQRLNKLYKQSIKEEDILAILKPLFKRWALERNEKEPFGDFLVRTGVIAETTEGKNFWDNVPEEA